MKKVYCLNCKYMIMDDRSPEMCINIYKKSKLNNTQINYCEDLNKQKNCKYYKRKWWNFFEVKMKKNKIYK